MSSLSGDRTGSVIDALGGFSRWGMRRAGDTERGVADYRLTYDSEAGAVYLTLGAGEVVRTVEIVPDRAWVDVASSGEVVGIEGVGIHGDDLPAVLRQLEELLSRVDEDDNHHGLLALA